MKKIIVFLFVFVLFIGCRQNKIIHPLTVTKKGHYLLKHDQPFFWMGDTAWELFHRLNREEAEKYILTRKNQGFNVFQAVVLPELDAFSLPNAYGDFPLIDGNISQPTITEGKDPNNAEQYDYFDHVEWIIQKAFAKRMMAGVLPCWGEYVTPRKRERTISTLEQGYEYGWFLGDRLKHLNDNIIWILGGDRLPDEAENGIEIWRAMAEGITDAVNGEKEFNQKANYKATFMTYHCYTTSAKWFHEDDWIDMHTWGSYHEKRNNERAFTTASNDWNLDNPKPTLNSEPTYENLPINYDWAEAKNGYFDEFDVRQQAYWSVFSGTCGHTYGAHPVWQMSKKDLVHEALAPTTKDTWEQGLNYPGGNQMKFLIKLMLSRPFTEGIPAQDILVENVYDPVGQLVATQGENYAMIYIPTGKEVRIDLEKLNGIQSVAWWYHPGTGESVHIGEFENIGIKKFDAPGDTQRGNDWVLVIDNKDSRFPKPGKVLR